VARSERALSFGGAADAYDRYRPSPPAQAVEWALPAGANDVLDLGAGTGALTRRLVERVPGRVVAAEPDARMLAALVRRTPHALVVGAMAEALPFAVHSFDAVVISSAWHWMEPAPTLDELARVLRPRGTLAVMWNGPAREVDWVSDLMGRAVRSRRPDRPQARFEMPPGGQFAEPEMQVFTWTAAMNKQELVGLSGTYSRVIVRPANEQAEFFRRLELRVERHFSAVETIDVPMRCRCWRMRLHER
jgi:SAM-dependent methyltransferase